MSICKYVSFTLLTLFIIPIHLSADILNVPEEYERIQDAMEEVEEGDTVLLAPGRYVGSITLPRYIRITLASWHLLTGDDMYIDSTILDGNGTSYLINPYNHNIDEITIQGLTLTNSRNYGIYAVGGDIKIMYCVFRDNEGTGAYFRDVDTLLIENCIFSDNGSERNNAGAIDLRSGDFEGLRIIKNTIFTDNFGEVGSVITVIGSNYNTSIINCTIVDNEADSSGAAIYCNDRSELEVSNSIVWNNSPRNIIFEPRNDDYTMSVDYSDVEGGEEEVGRNDYGEMIWGENNIDDDPLLIETDRGDYVLDEDSPCIDAGDPDSPEDPNGTRADIGAPPIFVSAVVQGTVYDSETDVPLEDVNIFIADYHSTKSDSLGAWSMPTFSNTRFKLTASKTGYNDAIFLDLEIDYMDTLELEIDLLHPEFLPDVERVDEQLGEGDSVTVRFGISNDGNGPLEWKIEKRLMPEFDHYPFELKESIEASHIVEDERLQGVCYLDGNYYLTGRQRWEGDDGPGMIYVLSRDGELIDSYQQPDSDDRIGMADLACGPETGMIWGAVQGRIYGLNIAGYVITEWGVRHLNSVVQSLTWDAERELLWLASITSDIYGYTADGQIQDTIPRGDFRNYGFAWWQDDPDGYPLYVLSRYGDDPMKLFKVDPDNDNYIAVDGYVPRDSTDTGGIFITDQLDRYSVALLQLTGDRDDDRIDVWQMHKNTGWFDVDPAFGNLQSEGEQQIRLSFFATNVVSEIYEGRLRFVHNASGGELWLPLSMEVILDAPSAGILNPSSFSLSTPYPNPFNSSTRLTYSIPQAGEVTLKLFDVAGRKVAVLDDGVQQSGTYSRVLEAGDLPSGLYLVRRFFAKVALPSP